MKKLIFLLFFFLVLTITGTISAENMKLAVITEVENTTAPSYNYASKLAMEELEIDFNINYDFIKTELLTDYLPKLSYLAESQADLIWAIGPSMQQSLKETAQMYSQKKFIIIDGIVELDNVLSINFAVEEGSFLAGVIAALKSESVVIAFIGERENNRSKKYEAGFFAGAKQVDQDIKLLSKYLCANNFKDTARETADQLYFNGADVIYYFTGSASDAIIASAEANDFYLIGVENKTVETVSDKILTNVIKNISYVLKKESNNFFDDAFQNGSKAYNLANYGLTIDQKIADNKLSDSIIDKLELYKNKIINGELEVPDNFNNY
ncbi:BMP family lipoprotein [Halanaerobium hydrogeniformans]|uniref:Basic membrane lipoprotein n=1 Tax=Halanaerobium hydrogeniformans TaxID=656519 RepID=E4RJF7_HALHG|nr:BMP family ABC transporter substrate-binding protein [Halanaerobium hydrogeniformans]ADQ15377.1 basic membrane lipoprotein [Halanaerobium hydrogeniformans]